MAFQYPFTREIVNGKYDIDNPNYKDEYGRVIPLAKYVDQNMPGKQFKTCCEQGNMYFCFNEELTAEDQTTLDGLVATYKTLSSE